MKTLSQIELYARVVKKFNYRCGLNPSHPVDPGTTPHHIIPRGAGGKDVEENLIPLCAACHGKIHREGTRKWREKLVSKIHLTL